MKRHPRKKLPLDLPVLHGFVMSLAYHVNEGFPDFSLFSKPFIEFGLVHRPWLDFEEHINHYRVQGTMFLERNKIFNSADYGVTFVSNFGGEMGKEYKKRTNSSHLGKYGSIAVGIYNGWDAPASA